MDVKFAGSIDEKWVEIQEEIWEKIRLFIWERILIQGFIFTKFEVKREWANLNLHEK